MKRLPALAFGLMVAATIGAFFLTQHLKSGSPVVWNSPFPIPAVFNPVSGRSCPSANGKQLDYKSTFLNFGISSADTVGVYVVKAGNANGGPVATVTSGTEMQASSPQSQAGTHTFVWKGHLDKGGVAPDGSYLFRIALHHQGRTINLTNAPVQVLTVAARPRVLSVTETGAGTATTTTGTSTTTTTSAGTTTAGATTTTGPAILSPPQGTVTIRWTPSGTPGGYRRVWLDIYRTDVAGNPRRVTQIQIPKSDLTKFTATWDGRVDGRPAPAGTYLVGINVQNAACEPSSWPTVMPPAAGTTAGAGVTVRYLSVTPPLVPSAAGSRVTVPVVSQAPVTFKLRLAGTAKVLAHGNAAAGSGHVRVRLPKHKAGLYELTVHSAGHATTVPLVAYATGKAAAHARVLVVLPMLTWLGNSPVDDTGDGLPDTLKAGSAVQLNRPLVDGLPASVGDDAELLRYLRGQNFDFQVTTDLALDQGVGPGLVDRWGVLFPDGEAYLPKTLAGTVSGFVRGGGRVLALGTGSFKGTSAISGYPADPRAAAPVTTKSDLFGVQRGPLTATRGEVITELTDHLNLLGDAIAFSGFSHYQPIEPPAAEQTRASAAGIADGSPAIVAFPFGSGTVVEVGLPNFGASLTHNIDSQELLPNIWRKLAKLP